MNQGVVYIAYGENARKEARASIKSLQRHSDLPVAVVSDIPLEIEGTTDVYAPESDPGARLVKLSLDVLSPFDYTLYIDADTRIRSKIDGGVFQLLEWGWDMAITPSSNQDDKWLWHLTPDEVRRTREQIGYDSLQLQGGVIFFRKCEAISNLFALWRVEWERGGGLDQGALLRALHQYPVRIWLLGRPWNGGGKDGGIIEHQFGQAARGRVKPHATES